MLGISFLAKSLLVLVETDFHEHCRITHRLSLQKLTEKL